MQFKTKLYSTVLLGSLCFAGFVQADTLPPGSYLQSCSGCTFDGRTLMCTQCNTGGGGLIKGSNAAEPSSIDVTACPIRKVWNDKGTLKCDNGQ